MLQRHRGWGIWLCWVLGGCATSSGMAPLTPSMEPPAEEPALPTEPARTITNPAAPGGEAPHPSVLPFIQDDYPRALREAKARGLPLFVEAWAGW